MRYVFLIYSQESEWDSSSEVEQAAVINSYSEIAREARAKGILEAGDELQPVSTATSVRVRDGKTMITDGPFAETKEQLGGYFILNCENLDEAIEWAQRFPTAKTGSIEIRPIVENPGA
jgi:hypothetical protein